MKTIVAIICITILSVTAMLLGFDGKLFVVAVLAVAGLGGYPIYQHLKPH
ncbi:hypothetical protein ES703_76410 [subsurface metagenome]